MSVIMTTPEDDGTWPRARTEAAKTSARGTDGAHGRARASVDFTVRLADESSARGLLPSRGLNPL